MNSRVLAAACAGAALTLAFSLDAFAQRGGGGGMRGGAPTISRPIERPMTLPEQRRIPEPDRSSTRARVRAACADNPDAAFCSGGQSTSQLRRRIWNACHGDNPPTACRRVFGEHDGNSHLRRRIWNACHSSDAPPNFCRRIFGQDPSNPHLRRRIWNACHNGDLSPAFCRRIFGDA